MTFLEMLREEIYMNPRYRDETFYTLDEIARTHRLTRDAIKYRIKTKKLTAIRFPISAQTPQKWKYLIPRIELKKLSEFRVLEPTIIMHDQPAQILIEMEFEEWKRKNFTEYVHSREYWLQHMNYYDYLDTPEWKRKRLERLKFDDFRCQRCGTAKGLQVHHINYEHRGDTEEFDDLITLCKRCHTFIHGNDIGIED